MSDHTILFLIFLVLFAILIVDLVRAVR